MAAVAGEAAQVQGRQYRETVLGTWTGAAGSYGVLPAGGKVYVTGTPFPAAST